MTLKDYRKKRNLKTTPEPNAGPEVAHSSLNFCVQKHAARQLHYDFRLEYKGVLLSWAVPKGPSLNPEDKRLAVKVEDHPISYQYFEGTIPKGNYGAGTVEIWDHGTYQIQGASTKKDAEKAITKGLKEGHFSFILQGKKLKGEFTLHKLKKDGDDHSWLLFKKNDAFANHL